MTTAQTKTEQSSTTTRRSPKWKCSEDTIERILSTTEQLIINNGLLKLSTNKIAKAANMSVGTIYQYFNNKEEIIARLYEAKLEAVFQVVVGALLEIDDQPTLSGLMQLIRTRVADSERELQTEFIESLNSLAIPAIDEINNNLSKRFANTFADFLVKAGSQWEYQRLVKLSYFAHAVYGIAMWRAATRIGGVDKELEEWRDNAFENVLAQAFD